MLKIKTEESWQLGKDDGWNNLQYEVENQDETIRSSALTMLPWLGHSFQSFPTMTNMTNTFRTFWKELYNSANTFISAALVFSCFSHAAKIIENHSGGALAAMPDRTAEFPEILLPCKLFVEAQSTNKAWPSIGILLSLDCRDESCRTTTSNSQKQISTNEPRDPRGPHGFQRQIKMFYIRLAGEIRHWITALIISSM